MSDTGFEPLPKSERKARIGWYMFDWASQPFHTVLLTFIFAAYFANQVAPDPVSGQAWWGYASGIGAFIIAVFAPILGVISDRTGPRKPWIFIFSILIAVGCWGLWFSEPNASNVLLILAAYILALIGIEFATVFTNSMLPSISTSKTVGRISGYGWGIGYAGGLICLIIVLVAMVANPQTGLTLIGIAPVFGLDPQTFEGERATGPLSALWFIIFIWPLFLFTPDERHNPKADISAKAITSELKDTVKLIFKERNLAQFYIASLFYRDGLVALFAFGAIYAGGVMGWSITQIGIFGILLNFTGILGCFLGGVLDDRIGPKKTVVLAAWLLVVFSTLMVGTGKTTILFGIEVGAELANIVFFVVGGFIGACGGPLQAASRSLLVRIAPDDQQARYFGVYALTGKGSAFIGPLLVGLMTDLSGSQPIGVTPIIVLLALGAILILPVKVQKVAT